MNDTQYVGCIEQEFVVRVWRQLQKHREGVLGSTYFGMLLLQQVPTVDVIFMYVYLYYANFHLIPTYVSHDNTLGCVLIRYE